MLSHLLCLIVSSNHVGTSALPDNVPEDLRSDEGTEKTAIVNENESNWKSTVSATAKLLLRGVNESASAISPLKSVAGGLCFILQNYEVWSSSRIC